MLTMQAKSVVAGALADHCTRCDAEPGEPCTRPDGTLVSFKGHLGVHSERWLISRGTNVGSS